MVFFVSKHLLATLTKFCCRKTERRFVKALTQPRPQKTRASPHQSWIWLSTPVELPPKLVRSNAAFYAQGAPKFLVRVLLLQLVCAICHFPTRNEQFFDSCENGLFSPHPRISIWPTRPSSNVHLLYFPSFCRGAGRRHTCYVRS